MVPDLAGLTSSQAIEIIEQAGLTAESQNAGQPTSSSEADKVTAQQPTAGTQVKPGSKVMISVLGAYVPGKDEQIASAGQQCAEQLRGSEAEWDEASASAKCVCPAGSQSNLDNTACVTPPIQQTAQGEEDYFVGVWGLSQAACSGRVPPPKPSTGSSSETLGEAIGEAIGEGLEQAFATMGFSFSGDGVYSWVNIPTGESAPVGRWFYDNGVLSIRGTLSDAGDADGDVRVLEQRPDSFVMDDLKTDDRITLWRCSAPDTGQSTGTDEESSTGPSCYSVAEDLRERIESRAIVGRQAEQELRQAGCSEEVLDMCPFGTFGQSDWPECLAATGYEY